MANFISGDEHTKSLLLTAAICLAGCISNTSYTHVLPGEAANVLQPGDTVQVIRKDGSEELLKIKKIDDTELFGSDQTSMFGRIKKTIALSDINSIQVSQKTGGYDVEQTIEAWSYLLILWPFFVF